MRRGTIKHFVGAVVVAGLGSTGAHAGVFRDIGLGLGYAGFNVQGQRNVLSGGVDLSVNRNFVGNALDFGAWDLTLQGPLAFEVSTGGRNLAQLDVRLSTAQLGGATAAPLAYELNYDVGGQSTQISGTLLLDANFSLNAFGFYDATFTYSSRQDVTNEGRFSNDERELDFDLGPFDVSGNIFADVLALVTQPIFDQAGVTNPFAAFSGRAKLALVAPDTVLARLAAGEDVVGADRGDLLTPGAGGPLVPSSFESETSQNARSGDAPGAGVVPEPSVMLLMLLAAPLILRRSRR